MNTGAFENESRESKVFSFVRLEDTFKSSPTSNIKNTQDYLRDKEINYHIPAEQIYRIKVKNIDETYLKNFGMHYLKLFQKLIDKSVQKNPRTEYSNLCEDVLFHLNYIKNTKIKEIPSSTEKIMKVLTDYVIEDNYRQPMILSGELGSGKTSLISTFSTNLFLLLGAHERNTTFTKHAIIVRFIGIDAKTFYLRTLLKSICLQIYYIKKSQNKDIKLEEVPKKLSDLKIYFKRLLSEDVDRYSEPSEQTTELYNKKRPKLIVILESLQDISKNDNSYKLDWLPKSLSQYCKLIITVSSESSELFQRLQKKYNNQRSYIQLGHLNNEQADFMVRKLLKTKNYRLEPNQLELLNDLMRRKQIRSLHLKILSEEFLNWKSYTTECILKETLNEAIVFYLSKLESKFGRIFVQHTLST